MMSGRCLCLVGGAYSEWEGFRVSGRGLGVLILGLFY